MNNITLTIKIESVASSQIKNQLKVEGSCLFKFNNYGEVFARPISYQSIGWSANKIKAAGAGSILVVTGEISIYPPSEDSPNHQIVLTISQVMSITTANNKPKANSSTEKELVGAIALGKL